MGAAKLPEASVVTAAPFGKMPLAPLLGASKVTDTPLRTELPRVSVTVPCSGVAKAVPAVVVWFVPAVGVMMTPGVAANSEVLPVMALVAVAVTT